MGISEILIIYLSIGAPIGVYAIIRSQNSLAKNLAVILAANVLFWPVCASLEFLPRSVDRQGPKYFDDRNKRPIIEFEQVRTRFSASLEKLGDRNFRREALEDFDRLAGISNAIPAKISKAEIKVQEIFEVASHPNLLLASKCLFRKNRRKLLEHRERAFTDMNSLAGELKINERITYNSAIETIRTNLLDRTIS